MFETRSSGANDARSRAPVRVIIKQTVFALCVCAMLAITPSGACASEPLEQGLRSFERADFEGALSAFSRAEQASDLTREDAIELLATRALTLLALGDAEAMQRDLRALASLFPEYRFGPEAPPEITEALATWVERGETLVVALEASRTDDQVTIEAEATDHAGIVRQLFVFARKEGDRQYTQADRTLKLSVPASWAVEYFAQARGPGDAVIAQAASADEPRRIAPATPPAAPTSRTEQSPRTSSRKWIWWVAGGAAVIAAGALTAVLATRDRSSGVTKIE